MKIVLKIVKNIKTILNIVKNGGYFRELQFDHNNLYASLYYSNAIVCNTIINR